jgi:formylmethanofuran dehydrogenase subunit E
MVYMFTKILAVGTLLISTSLARAETKDDWIRIGTQIHGAFGPFIPVGIRIGLDAVQRFQAGPRDLIVTYLNGALPPCPCIADGVMIATRTSPGQGTFALDPSPAPDGSLAIIIIRNKQSGEALRYAIDDAWLPKILAWRSEDASGRYDAAMKAEGLFEVRAGN